jgi:hypothetical protein
MSQNGQKVSHSCWSIGQINVSMVSGNEQLTFNFLNMFVSRGHPIGLTAFSLIEPVKFNMTLTFRFKLPDRTSPKAIMIRNPFTGKRQKIGL